MEQILLNGISVEQLLDRIEKVIQNKLDQGQIQQSSQSEYLSRKQVSELLKVSLVTLHDWTKSGLILSYKIGNRVLFKPTEIEEALKKARFGHQKKSKL